MLKLLFIAIFSIQGWFLPLHSVENERENVFKRLQEFTFALDQKNENNLASFWTEDGELVLPATGEVIEGREAIAKYLSKKMEGLSGKKIAFKEVRIEFPNSDKAVVEGVFNISENGELKDRKARKFELVKQDGKWYLDTAREFDIELPPALYERLKGLEWMIGKWKDQDDDVTITFSTKWDKYKNFLIQNFNVGIYGTDTLEGMQVIGWDPIQEKIHSWIFDSDGGVGSGVWTKEDKSWKEVVSYTLSDGRKASAINIYTPIDQKSYSYSSIGRDVGGEVLPDIEPLTVVKEE